MKLRYGLIGGGHGGFIGGVHRRAAAFDYLAELSAGVFSRNREASLESARLWNVAPDRTYADYKEMAEAESCREDGIDFVCVATPNFTHYDICRTFLEHGIHVMCDKPMTITVEEAEDLERLAREKGLLLGVTYTYSGYPILEQAKDILASGMAGKILTLNARYEEDYMIDWKPSASESRNAWQSDVSRNGKSGCTAGIGTHAEYLLHFLTGLRLEKVLARFQYSLPGCPVETGVQALLAYEGGVQGSLLSSTTAVGHHNDIGVEVQCEKGTIRWSQYDATRLYVDMIGEPQRVYDAGRPYLSENCQALCRLPGGHPEGYYEAFANVYRRFCTDLAEKKAGRDISSFRFPTVTDGLNGIRFVEACYNSHHAGNIWMDV